MYNAYSNMSPGKNPAFRAALRRWQPISALGRILRGSAQWVLQRWKALAVAGLIITPVLASTWVLIGMDVTLEHRSFALRLHINDSETRFQRLATLFGASITDHRASLVRLADHAAQRHGINQHLFRALIRQESAWRPQIVSNRGAAGLTQLMPETAQSECGLKPDERFEPAKNLDCGARYFAKQLKRFKSVDLALAAYNAGPNRVARLGRIPRIPETQNYVSRIIADWNGGGQNG